MTSSALAAGSVFHGRYRVIRTIKSGGMGTVYEALDTTTNSPRALKVMLPSTVEDPDQRARFALEAKVTGNIESDHVVRVFDAGVEASGEPFLVMELLRGEDLQSVLAKRGALPPEEVLAHLSQLARLLEKTHAAGIVHRDLKPENLFLTRRDDGTPCLKVLDFGIAKVVAQEQAKKTRALGTPLYMAPEQIRGEGGIGPSADLYAYAQVAYALLTGEAYWTEDSKAHDSLYPLLMTLLGGTTEAPSARAWRRSQTRLPPAFDAWFLRAASPEPRARFESVAALTSALAAALRGQPAPAAGSPASMAVPPVGAGPTRPSEYAPQATGPVTNTPYSPAISVRGAPQAPGATGGYGAPPQAPTAPYATGPQGANAPYGTGSQGTTAAYGTAPQGANAGYATAPQGANAGYATGPQAQGASWGPAPGHMPAGPTWGTGQPPPPGYAPPLPPKATSPLRWALPAGGAVVLLVAVALVVVLTRSSDGTPAPQGACGEAARCLLTSVPDAAHVEPLDLLPQAKQLAQGVDKRAALFGIFVTDAVKDGSIDLTSGYGTLMFHFGTPEGALTVLYRAKYTSVTRGPGFGENLPDPRCSMKAAWKAALAAGAPTGKPMSILYQPDPPYGGAVWLVNSQNKLFYVDGASCALKRAPK